jgi:hypothetical protein
MHIKLPNTYGFCKNEPNESPTFLIGFSGNTLTHVTKKKKGGIYESNQSAGEFCALRHGMHNLLSS